MILQPINDTTNPLLARVERLYTDAFPLCERRDWSEFVRIMRSEPRFCCHAILTEADNAEEPAFAGFINSWDYDERFTYIEHFAVLPTLRCRGVGGKALDLLISRAGKPVMLEAEVPVDELTRRRQAFYARHGLRVLRTDYLQPAYRRSDAPVPLYVLGTLDSFTDADIEQHYQVVYHTTRSAHPNA